MAEVASVLITGAARRIGAAIAERLAAAGFNLFLHCYRSRDEAVALAARLTGEYGVDCHVISGDLADAEAVADLVAQCRAASDQTVDHVVNNASLFEYDALPDFEAARLQRTLQINLTAPLQLAQALAAQTNPDQRDRCVINLLDQKVFNLNPDFFSYTVSKQALTAATLLLARSMAPMRVCGVAPGISLPSGGQTEAEFALAHRQTPLGASSTPADIAAAVCFLLQSRSITGQVLTVDGGQHMLPLDRDVMFVAN